jgi:hypothetical protein
MGKAEMKRIDKDYQRVASLPDLATSVALSNAAGRREVGGLICLGLAGTVVTYFAV